MQLVNGLRFDNIRGDIYGGVTAAVVALPLALAFGVASGAGPMAGLYGAIFVGFFASMFGGTPTQISGPTGPMTVVMTLVVTKYAHEPALAFTVVMMGGAIQIALGATRVGRFITLVPLTVISGFMSGIGVIIIILQLAPLMGHAIPPGGTIGALIALPGIVLDLKWDAAAIGALALAIAYLTPRRIKRLLPPPLIALIAGTAVVWFVLRDVPILGDIPTGLPDPQLPTLELAAFPDMFGSAVILALLGAIDSLLTSLIADSVTRTNHNSNRELVGQGIGNMVAGLFGGIPGAGATMRTVINVRSGGRTPISGMLHAVILLALVLGLGPLAGNIPHAVLAGILISVGIDIIDWRFLRRVRTAPRSGVLIMFLVLGLTVFVDLIMAVAVGIVVASLLFVNRMSAQQLGSIQAADGDLAEVPLTKDEEVFLSRHAKEVMLYKLAGPMSFGAAKGITHRLVCSDTYKVLMLDLSEVTFIDTSAGLALETVVVNACDQGKEVFLIGMRVPVRKILHRLGALDHVPANRRFATRRMAFERVAKVVDGVREA